MRGIIFRDVYGGTLEPALRYSTDQALDDVAVWLGFRSSLCYNNWCKNVGDPEFRARLLAAQ